MRTPGDRRATIVAQRVPSDAGKKSLGMSVAAGTRSAEQVPASSITLVADWRKPTMARETIRSSSSRASSDRVRQASSAAVDVSRSNPRANQTSRGSSNARGSASNAGDRERAIATGREAGPAANIDRSERIPPIYQHAANLGANPFTLMRRMAEDMDRLFQDFGFANALPGISSAAAARDPWRQARSIAQGWAPQIETFRRGDRLIIRADLPGLKRDDVKVEVDGDLLAISGERRSEREDSRDDYYRSERHYGQFYRAIPLPEGANADEINASFRDGVLEISLRAPRDSAPSRRKEIRVS
jgi:HSP20 family protein